MASTRLAYILDENTLSRGKLVAIFDRTGVGVQLFAKTLATALVEKKIYATTRNRLISVIEYIATVDPSNSY